MKPFLRVVALTTAAVLAVLSGGGPASADQSDSVANRVGPSLVFIETEFTARVQVPFVTGSRWTDSLTVTGNCTGYVVDPAGYVATAGHCVNNKDESILNSFRQQAVTFVARIQGRDQAWVSRLSQQASEEKWPVAAEGVTDGASREVRLRQPTGGTQAFPDWTPVDVVAFQDFEQGDNAVLKVANPPDGLRALVVSDRAPEPGEEVVAVGFPGAVQSTNESEAIAQPSYKNGTVSSRQTTGSGLVRTEISAVLGRGMSGGPTVDENAQVIGTNSAGASLTDERASFNFITDNVALRGYLEQNGVTLAAPERKSSSVNMWLWLGPLLGLAVLVLLAVAAWLLLRRRKRPASNAGPAGPVPPGPVPPYPGGPYPGPQQPGPQRAAAQQPAVRRHDARQPGAGGSAAPYPGAASRPVQPPARPGHSGQPGRSAPAGPPSGASDPTTVHRRPQQAGQSVPAPHARPHSPQQQAPQQPPTPQTPKTPPAKPEPPRPDPSESQPTVLNQPLPPQPPRKPGDSPPPGQSGPPGRPHR
ncbi:S1 family peptidase [Gordonia caeni]|uniref:Trypsin-like serine protease n=1 Tax=Gordonia caeni TaxID=1007097 RepID=A0ABP7PTH3_9ACTN